MKLVCGDSGHDEREQIVDEVLLAPSERTVVVVLVEQPGYMTLEHRPAPLNDAGPPARVDARPESGRVFIKP